MKANQLIFALIFTGFVSNTFAAKPPPKPAGDVDCVGCVGTTDIEDGAVTTEKLSADVQNVINQLKDRIAELESRLITPVLIDSQGKVVGHVLARGEDTSLSGTYDWYDATVGFSENGQTFMLRGLTDKLFGGNVYFSGSNCSGVAYINEFNWADMLVQGGIYDNLVYAPDTTNGSQSFSYLSTGYDNDCNNNNTGTANGFPAFQTSIDISQFVPPYSIKLSP